MWRPRLWRGLLRRLKTNGSFSRGEQAEDVSAAEDVESLQLKRLSVQQMKRLRMQQQGFGVDQH